VKTQVSSRLLTCIILAVLAAMAGCAHKCAYMDFVGSLDKAGFIAPGATTLPLQVVDTQGQPAAGIEVTVASKTGHIRLVSDSKGMITLPLSDDLRRENPWIVPQKGQHGSIMFLTGGRAIATGEQRVYVSLDDKEKIAGDHFTVWYPPECSAAALAARDVLARQCDLIKRVTGLEPVSWGVVILPEMAKDKSYLAGFAWCYTAEEVQSTHFAKVNAHEWTEATITHTLRIYDADHANRFIGDGLAEYVAFLDTSTQSARSLDGLKQAGRHSFDLLTNFRAVEGHPDDFASSKKMLELLDKQGCPEGYPLSFVFWYELSSQAGPDVPARFIAMMKDSKKKDSATAIRLLEQISGQKDLRRRLTEADVDNAISVIEKLKDAGPAAGTAAEKQ